MEKTILSSIEFKVHGNSLTAVPEIIDSPFHLSLINRQDEILFFDGQVFNSTIEIEVCSFKGLVFRKCTFNHPISIHNGNNIKTIEFHECEAKKEA